ncbi:hypothetical protein [Sphaerothrix gracilis]|uniref:hypothetical protein n=1 Tax=Sphaerothrix gracilis TaxID=3151835 RepID=UPI0031FCDBD6
MRKLYDFFRERGWQLTKIQGTLEMTLSQDLLGGHSGFIFSESAFLLSANLSQQHLCLHLHLLGHGLSVEPGILSALILTS